MAKFSSLERRGAVYYWRRRIPRRLIASVRRTHFRLCLATKESDLARLLGRKLDATADEVFLVAPQTISNEELRAIFASAFKAHQEKLQLLADIERSDGAYVPAQDARRNRSMGLAYRHLSRFGEQAPFDNDAREALVREGASEAELEQVAGQLEFLRKAGLARGSANRIKAILEQNAIEANSVNLVKAQPLYLRALGEALIESSNTAGSDRLQFDSIIAELASPDPLKPPPEALAGTNGQDVSSRMIDQVSERSETTVPADPAPVQEVGERLIQRKLKDKEWDTKTVRQARSIFNLFSRFLSETMGTDDLQALRQSTLSAFDGFLLELKKSYGKSPADKVKTIAELRRESKGKPDDRRGLDIPTRNRHYTNLNLLLKEARKGGYKLDSDLNISDFRGRTQKIARLARPKPKVEQVSPIFHSPVFLGCKGWRHPHIKGEHVYHSSLYFGLMLAVYQGARREEFCGLLVDDVIRNGHIPYLHINYNKQRRIKNAHSIRNLALHPEIVRLGFLDYADAIAALGYEHLFPDLYSPTTSSPMGDHFYDEAKKVLGVSGVTPHQFRHYFNNTLKQVGVATEERADLLGQIGGSETADRYCDPMELQLQLNVLAKLPVVTDHLDELPINLFPWVQRREVAPWSHAARRNRRIF